MGTNFGEIRDKENDKLIYETLSNKRIAYDNLIWQTPVLGIAAQSFLYTIALDISNLEYVRLFSSFLIAILGLATLQLFMKHRYHEEQVNKNLNDFEALLNMPRLHEKPSKEEFNSKNYKDWEIFFIRGKSYKIWRNALLVTTISFLFPLVIAINDLSKPDEQITKCNEKCCCIDKK